MRDPSAGVKVVKLKNESIHNNVDYVHVLCTCNKLCMYIENTRWKDCVRRNRIAGLTQLDWESLLLGK